jgi:hypothetical protein
MPAIPAEHDATDEREGMGFDAETQAEFYYLVRVNKLTDQVPLDAPWTCHEPKSSTPSRSKTGSTKDEKQDLAIGYG